MSTTTPEQAKLLELWMLEQTYKDARFRKQWDIARAAALNIAQVLRELELEAKQGEGP